MGLGREWLENPLRRGSGTVASVVWSLFSRHQCPVHKAEDESQDRPELHDAIRDARKAYQADGMMPEPEHLGTLTDEVRTAV